MLVKYNRAAILGFKDVLIKPGINNLSADFVLDMQDDPIIAHKFENGELEIIEIEGVRSKNGVEVTAAERLALAPDNDAKKLTTQTVDISILEDWFKKEKRVAIRKSIKEQIAKIKNVKFRETDPQKFEGKKEE